LNQHSLNPDEAVVDLSGGAPSIRAFLGYAGWSRWATRGRDETKSDGLLQKAQRSGVKFERLSRLGSTS